VPVAQLTLSSGLVAIIGGLSDRDWQEVQARICTALAVS